MGLGEPIFVVRQAKFAILGKWERIFLFRQPKLAWWRNDEGVFLVFYRLSGVFAGFP
ncbi:hypothetical protein D477_003003 [Arthrobacter crystallopoietes BAB-32]|uniref:Uncharacterized protein n=1 Tax=Arthrobacter crystallopoietes BAB-32 TaxID=1246476 RepID=N1V6I1_9MICC|nr:hypothetical protein D477_003003 [Arthrobacter crystallopoietes BAB-32]